MYKRQVKRESASLAAAKDGFLFDPIIKNKIFNVENQILVNLVYDYTVAFPLISRESLALSQTNLKKDVFIKHLLVAHDASVLSSPPQRSKEEALGLISSIKDSLDSKTLSFEGFSKKYSDDPSAARNGGVLGWLQWGVTPMSFQSSVWSLDIGETSERVTFNSIRNFFGKTWKGICFVAAKNLGNKGSFAPNLLKVQ